MNRRALFPLVFVVSLALIALTAGTLAQEPESPAPLCSPPREVRQAENQYAHNVELTGQIGGISLAVAAQGPTAYVGVGPRLVILNTSNPLQPVVVGQSSPMPDLVQGVTVAGNLAYVADGEGGLYIFYVANPAAPALLSSYDTQGETQGVAVVGHYAYVADGYGGLRILDVAQPACPKELSHTGWSGDGVRVAGNYAYVVSNGLHIFDVSDPAAPVEIGSWEGYTNPDLELVGNYVYLATYDGLSILDVADPAHPTEVASFDVFFGVAAVEVQGSHAYMGTLSELTVYDIANPLAPIQVGQADCGRSPIFLYHVAEGGIAVTDEVAYVAGLDDGLCIVNVANPSSPTVAGSYDAMGYATDVAALGNYAYVTDNLGDLRVVDASNPAALVQVGFNRGPGPGAGIVAAGTQVYIAEGSSGMRVVDVSNPADPTQVGALELSMGWNDDVAMAGTTVYMAEQSELYKGRWRGGGLRVVDVSSPAAPSQAGYYDGTGSALGRWQANSVVTAGGYAYVADLVGLYIMDIANPSAPSQAGLYTSQNSANGVAVGGNYAYVAQDYDGLNIVSIADPAAPQQVGLTDTPGTAYDVALSGDYAYVADREGGLRVLNVSDPAAPFEAGFFNPPAMDRAKKVFTVGETAYVADEEGGLFLLHFAGEPPPTPEPTVTPSVPWLSWSAPDSALLLRAGGELVEVVYGNIPVPASLTATLQGPVIFASGSQVLTALISNADGAYSLALRPEVDATAGTAFTLEVDLAGVELERRGAIAWELYLPLVLKKDC